MEESKRKRKRNKTRNIRLTSTTVDTVTVADIGVTKPKPCPSKRAKYLVENYMPSENENIRKKKRRRRRRKRHIKVSNADQESMDFNDATSTSKRHDTRKEHTAVAPSSFSSFEGKSQQLTCIESTSIILRQNSAVSAGPISNESRKDAKRCSFKERLQNKLESGRFRWINEKLYTSDSNCALKLFENDRSLFDVYHQGFSSQVQKWPVNPLDEMIDWINKRSSKLVIVDMGCGEAKISQSVPNKVFSFDLVAANKFVTVCDMAKVPLPDNSVHVVIFCLSLMGTNLNDFLKEAQRILKNGGIMKVAEVVSRFDDIENFEEAVCRFGFSLLNKDTTNKMFVQFDFKKSSNKRVPVNIVNFSLKPCLYKKR